MSSNLDSTELAELARYFAGEATAAEAGEIAARLSSDAAYAREVEQLGQGWTIAGDTVVDWDTKSMWLGVASAASITQREQNIVAVSSPNVVKIHPYTQAPQKSSLYSARYWAWAAAILVVIAGAGIKYSSKNTTQNHLSTRTYTTKPGERATVRLADGTRVTLAPASRLRISPEFGESRRDVYVDGLAYFDVTHKPSAPFTVFSANTSTQVLGTSFTIRKYPSDKSVKVVVATGKVALSGAGVLAPGDVGELDAAGKARVQHNVPLAQQIGWIDGKLAFDAEPVSQILAELNNWYGITLRVSDERMLNRRITLALPPNSNEQTMLNVLAMLLQAKAERSGNVITLVLTT